MMNKLLGISLTFFNNMNSVHNFKENDRNIVQNDYYFKQNIRDF